MARLHRRRRHRLGLGGLIAVLLLTLLSALILLPIVATFLLSFFPKSEIAAWQAQRGQYTEQWMSVLFSPAQFSLRQYYTILIEEPSYLQYYCNSALYALLILAGQALIIPLTAYALSRFTFRGRDALFFLILILMILPFQVTMTPNMILMRELKLLNTIWAVVLPMCFSPFYIFLLRQFMVSIPNELLEAGMVDGAGPIRGFVHVILPVCRPIIGAAAALSFADIWNMVEEPLVYLDKAESLKPLSTVFNDISAQSTANSSVAGIAFAGAALYILPTLLLYLYFQEDIVTGIQLSELK